jgi:hypothetical protein
MTMLILLTAALVTAALTAVALAPALGRWQARRRRHASAAALSFDPGRDRRAEQRARQLLRSCVNEREWTMYRDLGFIRVDGRRLPDSDVGEDAPYAYLIYPHKPIVAYAPESGRLLSEYCVEFPDVIDGRRARLPASDDVLAKWMALTSDEARVIGRANMHLVGRQHDPGHVRRDIWRLSEWERLGAGHGSKARTA